jgi:hypothetical protein
VIDISLALNNAEKVSKVRAKETITMLCVKVSYPRAVNGRNYSFPSIAFFFDVSCRGHINPFLYKNCAVTRLEQFLDPTDTQLAERHHNLIRSVWWKLSMYRVGDCAKLVINVDTFQAVVRIYDVNPVDRSVADCAADFPRF